MPRFNTISAVALVLAAACSAVQAFLLPTPGRGPAPSTAASTSLTTRTLLAPAPSTRYDRVGRLYMGRRAAKIAARKGKSDALKTKVYATYGKKLVMAVKAGGPDPEVNRALFQLIREAKAQGVPNDNIQRAIQRGSSADDADYKEAVYEAYGYGGAGIIINCLTDNTNRAKTEINNVIKKTEVKLATTGSVAFNFERRGLLEVVGSLEEDQVIEAALEADVEDVESKVEDEDGKAVTKVIVDPASVSALREVLTDKLGLEVRATKLVNVPKVFAECSDEDFENNMNVVEALEELDDVDSVEHNLPDDDE